METANQRSHGPELADVFRACGKEFASALHLKESLSTTARKTTYPITLGRTYDLPDPRKNTRVTGIHLSLLSRRTNDT